MFQKEYDIETLRDVLGYNSVSVTSDWYFYTNLDQKRGTTELISGENERDL